MNKKKERIEPRKTWAVSRKILKRLEMLKQLKL